MASTCGSNTALSGKDGTLYLCGEEVSSVRNWEVDSDANPKVFGDNTVKAKQRIAGMPDSTGTFQIIMRTGVVCPVYEGAYYDARFDPEENVGNAIFVNIMVTRIRVTCNIGEGDEMMWDVSWGGNGPLAGEGLGSSSSGA